MAKSRGSIDCGNDTLYRNDDKSDDDNDDDITNNPMAIIDIGSCMSKVGISGNDLPDNVFQTVCGKHRNNKKKYIGKHVFRNKNIEDILYPIKNGKILNWDGMENIIDYIYNKKLKIKSDNQGVLFSEYTFNTKKNRLKLIELMFEKYNVPTYYTCIQPLLTLMSHGEFTGTVVQSGEVTMIVPMIEGICVNSYNTIKRIKLGGDDITNYLGRLLKKSYGSIETKVLKDIKEKLCFTSLDYRNDLLGCLRDKNLHKKSYKLPDGKTIHVGLERFQSVEVLFNPYLVKIESNGIDKLINESLKFCNKDYTRELYNKIILSGGNTMFDDLGQRIKQNVVDIAPFGMKIRVKSSKVRNYSTWIGGSILSSLSTFNKNWITQDDYYENGSNIVNESCNFGVWLHQ